MSRVLPVFTQIPSAPVSTKVKILQHWNTPMRPELGTCNQRRDAVRKKHLVRLPAMHLASELCETICHLEVCENRWVKELRCGALTVSKANHVKNQSRCHPFCMLRGKNCSSIFAPYLTPTSVSWSTPAKVLEFWRRQNSQPIMISPVSFNKVSTACSASQASSASAERLFSDLGKLENNQS